MDIYYWDIGGEYRKLVLRIDNFERENSKMEKWEGNLKRCCKCRDSFPENTYFFASGGENILHKQCKICEGHNFGWGRKHNEEINKIGLKYCKKCDRTLPLNILYFNISNGRCNKNGFSSNCKQCIGGGNTRFGLSSINSCVEIKDIKNNYKVCHDCFYELPDNDIYFFKKSGRENGQTKCKKCLGYQYGIERLNRVLKNELDEFHRFCSICREIKHIDEMSNDSNCKICFKERTKFHNSKPEQKTRMRMNVQRRRNMLKNVVSNLTQQQFDDTLIYFNHSCAYCGMSEDEHYDVFNERLHLEHVIPLSKGGIFSKDNIIPACRSCNASKGNKDINDFYSRNKNFSEDRLLKINSFIENQKDKLIHI